MHSIPVTKALEEILSSHKKTTTTSIETSLLMLLLLLRNKGVDVVAFVVGLQFTHGVICCGTFVQFLGPAIERLLHLASLLESLELLVGLNKIRPFNDGGGVAILFDRIKGNLLFNQPAVFHLPFYSFAIFLHRDLFSIWKRLPNFFTDFLLNIIAIWHLFQVLCYMGLFLAAPGGEIFVDGVALLSLDPLEISLAVGPSNDVTFHFGDFHANVLLFVVAVFL